MRIVSFKLILIIVLVSSLIPQSKFVTNKSIENDQVDILLIFDNPFGPEYFHSRKILEDRFGWNVKTTSFFKTILPCDEESYPNETVNYTIDKVPILETFDIISNMGGPNQDNLMSSTAVLNLVKSAVQKGLIVSAWCRAVRVLAVADVIDGIHVTGYWDFKAEYEAAGAIYHNYVPPIIDGNIVTCFEHTISHGNVCSISKSCW
ncbi:MAG: DJ-1/PfpI family protein [Candidatus Heimdallarchaeota archaeon]